MKRETVSLYAVYCCTMMLFAVAVASCDSALKPSPSSAGIGLTPSAIMSTAILTTPQSAIIATTPAEQRHTPLPTLTPYPLVCPTVPVFPQATRVSYRSSNGGGKRTAVYETVAAPTQILQWFAENRRAPEWAWNGGDSTWVRYTNRGADEVNPSIAFVVRIENTTDVKTKYSVTLVIGHPHRNGNWCPELEP